MENVVDYYCMTGALHPEKSSSSSKLLPITHIIAWKSDSSEHLPAGFEFVMDRKRNAPFEFLMNDSSSCFLMMRRGSLAKPIEQVSVGRRNENGEFNVPADLEIVGSGADRKRFQFSVDEEKFILIVKRNATLNSVADAVLQNLYVDDVEDDDLVVAALQKGKFLKVSFVPVEINTANCDPSLLDKYPDSGDYGLPELFPLFCHSTGISLSQNPLNIKLLTFVLTNEVGLKIHVVALQYSELISGVYASRALSLVSKFPFYDSLSKLLLFMYATSKASMPYPIERLVQNAFEIPMPTPGLIQIEHFIGSFKVPFVTGTVDSIPPSKFPSNILFEFFSMKNVVLLMIMVLLEYKIIFHSKDESCLNPLIESLCDLIFPFKWQHM